MPKVSGSETSSYSEECCIQYPARFVVFKLCSVTGVTILLSLTVFLNLVAETLPQVSDAIPLLGTKRSLSDLPVLTTSSVLPDEMCYCVYVIVV